MSSQSTDGHGGEKRSHNYKFSLVKRDYDQYQVVQVGVAYEHNAPEDSRPRRPAWDNSFDNQDAWSDNERRRHDRKPELDREHKHRKRGVFLTVLGVVTMLLACFMHYF